MDNAALTVLAEGVQAAKDFDAAQVANAIRGLAGVDTPMGQLSFDSNGDLEEQTIYIFQVEDADWVQVYP